MLFCSYLNLLHVTVSIFKGHPRLYGFVSRPATDVSSLFAVLLIQAKVAMSLLTTFCLIKFVNKSIKVLLTKFTSWNFCLDGHIQDRRF